MLNERTGCSKTWCYIQSLYIID